MSHLSLKTKKLIIYSLLLGTIGSFLLFLLTNIFVSQVIPPLYFRLVKGDQNAAITFLNKIRSFPEFPTFLGMFSAMHGQSLQQDVFTKDQERKEEIQRSESLLEKNPKSRNLLYNLSLLYHEDGNLAKSAEYLKKAREIDPLLN